MDDGGEARRPLISEPLSAEERGVISHAPAGIDENDIEQGCASVVTLPNFYITACPDKRLGTTGHPL